MLIATGVLLIYLTDIFYKNITAGPLLAVCDYWHDTPTYIFCLNLVLLGLLVRYTTRQRG